jgi:hypothetical protein
VQLDFDRVLSVVSAVSFTPIVADSVRKDVACAREGSGRDAAADFGVALETVLGVLVPEVEGAVATSSAEGAVDGVEGDCVDRIDFSDVALVGIGLAVAFEGEVEAVVMVSMMCTMATGERAGLPGVFVFDVLNRTSAFD